MDIKELRKLSGMSQSQFSKEFDIPLKTLQKWEQGERIPPLYLVNILRDCMLYRGLVDQSVFKKGNKDMYKNIPLPEGVTKSIDELTEYDIQAWLDKYPNKCGLFLLNEENHSKGKLIAQSSVRAYKHFLLRYPDETSVIAVKGANYKTAEEQLLNIYGKTPDELPVIDINDWKKKNPNLCALVIKKDNKEEAFYIESYDIIEKEQRRHDVRNNIFYDDINYTII